MSDQLDDFFRENQRNVPEASPPPGQWEKIRNREMVHQPASAGAGWWWLAGGLLLGLVIGWPLGGFMIGNDCEALPQDAMNVAVAVPAPLSVAAAPAKVLAPPAKEQTKAAQKTAATSPEVKREAYAVAAPIAPKTSPGTRTPASLSNHVSATEIPSPQTDTLLLSAAPQPTIAAGPDYAFVPGNIAPLAINPPAGRGLSDLRSELGAYGSSAGIVVPPIARKAPTLKGRWETSLHLTPGWSAKSKSVQVLSSIDNGRTPQEFTFNEQEVSLFNERPLNVDIGRRFNIQILSLEVGRQFPNGIRVGLGAYWEPSRWNGLIRDQENTFNAQLLEDEWAYYLAAESESLSLGLSAGYTFRRRKRLRPYLGFYLGSRFYREWRFVERIYRRSDRATDFQNRVNSRQYADFGNLFFFAQAGLQYELNDHLSIGLEVVPGIGVGGRYRF